MVHHILKTIPQDKVKPYLVVSKEIAFHYQGLLPADQVLIVSGLFKNFRNPRIYRWYRLLDRRFHWKESRVKQLALSVGKWLSGNNIHTVHTHLLEDHLLVSEIKKQQPLKILLTVHGTLGLDPEDGYTTWLGVEKTLEVLKSADCLTSACQFFVDLLKLYGFHTDQFRIIPNGCEIHEAQLIQAEDRILPGQLIFLGGGRTHQKGGLLLIKALKILKERGFHKFHLILAGHVQPEGEERKWVSRLGLEDCVTFSGFIMPPKHLKAMARSELFVLPSNYEGVANSLLEAISLGMKVVATNVGGSAELLETYPAGLICERSAVDLADAIQKQLNTSSDLALDTRFQYQWNTISAAYAETYHTL